MFNFLNILKSFKRIVLLSCTILSLNYIAILLKIDLSLFNSICVYMGSNNIATLLKIDLSLFNSICVYICVYVYIWNQIYEKPV